MARTCRPFIARSTVRDYTIYLATITKFFGNPRLEKIANPDLIRDYQLERAKTNHMSNGKGDYVLDIRLSRRLVSLGT